MPIPLEDGGFDPSLPLVFTSRTAVQLFAELTPVRTARVFAVGEATAESARASGWTHVASADADVRAVAEMIRADGAVRRLLHPCAETPAGDLAAMLAPAGIALAPLVLYRTEFVGELPPAAARK